MKKILALDFDRFFVPDNTKEEFAGYLFENAVSDWDIIKAFRLGYSGLFTEHHLNNFSKYVKKGDTENAEKSARSAYKRYDSLINGVPEERLYDFSEKYAPSFSEDGAHVLDELKSNNWEVYLVSGAIKPCVDIILEENGVDNHFKGIYCNALDVEDGKIRGLIKNVITPYGKILKLEKENPSFIISEDVTAVGHDLWDYALLKNANRAIVFDTNEHPADAHMKEMIHARRECNRKSNMLYRLRELPGLLER